MRVHRTSTSTKVPRLYLPPPPVQLPNDLPVLHPMPIPHRYGMVSIGNPCIAGGRPRSTRVKSSKHACTPEGPAARCSSRARPQLLAKWLVGATVFLSLSLSLSLYSFCGSLCLLPHASRVSIRQISIRKNRHIVIHFNISLPARHTRRVLVVELT